MNRLGKLLRDSIESSGYTIYGVAKKADINRTTLQKVLSGDRPVSKELLSRLVPILKLSPAEEEDIRNMLEISEDGENLYSQRRYIKAMLESFTNMDLLHDQSIQSCERLLQYQSAILNHDQQIIYGLYHVGLLLTTLLDRESKSSNRIICMNIPGNLPILTHFFMGSLYRCSRQNHLTIQHITSLVKSPENTHKPLINLDILSTILPYTLFLDLNYSINFYYNDQLICDTLNVAFPYYILFSHMIVFLSADGCTALPVNDHEVILHFRNLFNEAIKHTFSLIASCSTPDDILEQLIEADKASHPYHSIEFQPCLATFLTENMIRKCAHPDLENRSHLIEAALFRTHQLSNLENRSCIFSQEGLLHFAKTGILTDFPPKYMLPLERPDRLLILKALYNACDTEKEILRMINPVTFSFPKHILCTLRSNYGLDFSGFDSSGQRFSYIRIKEHTILDAFEDFFQYLLKSSSLFTKKETLAEIKNVMNDL